MKKPPLPPFIVGALAIVICLSSAFVFIRAARPSYAERLKLPHLTAPRVVASTPGVTTAFYDQVSNSIRTASSPAQADSIVSQFRIGASVGASLSPNLQSGRDAVFKEGETGTAFLEQAAQIKRAQLENGDSTDSTGEVEKRLGEARQCGMNIDALKISP